MSSAEKSSSKPSHRLKWTILFTAASIFAPNLQSYYQVIPTPIIHTDSGPLQGRINYSRNGTKFWEFLSIPYAQPPAGSLRFQPPVPVKSWTNIIQATKYPPLCTQFEMVGRRRLFGVEDCLFINIATHPFQNSSLKSVRPVLVNIPGGGFSFGGSNHYGADYFMDFPDIVVVTLQYRLGALGFLNFEQTTEQNKLVNLPRGNMGLKDQALALKWIRSNIQYFGGDPQKITVYGQSAGGTSVHFHMISQKSRHYFQRAILHSGMALSYYSLDKTPRKRALNLAKQIGCPVNDSSEMLKCLKSVNAFDLVRHQNCASDPTAETDLILPSLERVQNNEDAFLTENPFDLLKSGNVSEIPVIFALNTGDGALRGGIFDAMPEFIEKVETTWTKSAARIPGFGQDFSEITANKVRNYYFPGNQSFTENPLRFKKKIVQMIEDSMAFEGVHTSAKIHARGSAPVFLQLFDYKPQGLPGFYFIYKSVKPGSWLPSEFLMFLDISKDFIYEKILGWGKGAFEYGAVHGQDLAFLWPFDPILRYIFSRKDTQFSQNYVKLVVDFVRGR